MQLHWAARRGDRSAVARHLRRGTSVDARDESGKTPLMYAAEGWRAGVPVLEQLIAAGADVNAVSDGLQETPLALAAHSGSLVKVQRLLQLGAEAKFVNDSGYSVITAVPSRRDMQSLEVLDVLLAAGADASAITEYGESPLRYALNAANFAAVRLLLDRGVDAGQAAMTPLMWSIALGSVEEVRAQLQSGADLAARNVWDMTPLLLSLTTGDVAKVELLLEHGTELSGRGRCGRSPLSYPAAIGDSRMLQWLLQRGADVDAVDEFGQTALKYAVDAGAAECAEALLQAGAELCLDDGGPVVTGAANFPTVRVLVQYGAHLDTVGDDGYWLLKSAAESGDVVFARELLAAGASPHTTSTGETALHTAVNWDELEIVDLLLRHGADPNAVDVDGWTTLMGARSLECAERLLAAGADPKASDQAGSSVAEQHRDLEILDRLQESGGTVHASPDSTGSLLHSAARDGNLELVEYALQRDVDVNQATSWGLTPLMAAAERCQIGALKRLIAAGAEVHASDHQGRTALFYAAAPEAFEAFRCAQEAAAIDITEFLPDGIDVADLPDFANVTSQLDYGYCPSDDVNCLDILLKAGAELEARDASGATVLLVASGCGRPARVARLLKLGANASARDNKDRAAWDLAAEHYDDQQGEEILRVLEKARAEG